MMSDKEQIKKLKIALQNAIYRMSWDADFIALHRHGKRTRTQELHDAVMLLAELGEVPIERNQDN